MPAARCRESPGLSIPACLHSSRPSPDCDHLRDIINHISNLICDLHIPRHRVVLLNTPPPLSILSTYIKHDKFLAVPVSVLTFFIIILLQPAPGSLHYKMNWTWGLILYSLPLSLSFSLSTFIKYKSLPAARLEATPGCG